MSWHPLRWAYVKSLGADEIACSMEDSTISLRKVLSGEPLTIYIIIPPEKLHSHRALLRLWVGVLLNTILKRQCQPEHRTLFILEEAAQLGTFSPLLTATTLMRAYGLLLITVWQNLAQLKSRYPNDWSTILDNCEMIMSFGLGHHGSAANSAITAALIQTDWLLFGPTRRRYLFVTKGRKSFAE